MKPQKAPSGPDIQFGQRLDTAPCPEPRARFVTGDPSCALKPDCVAGKEKYPVRPLVPYKRRVHERVETSFHANVYCHGRFQTALIRNVSCGGLMMKGAIGLGVGDAVTVRTLAGRSYEGRVAWSVMPFAGLVFHKPIDAGDPIFDPSYSAGKEHPIRPPDEAGVR